MRRNKQNTSFAVSIAVGGLMAVLIAVICSGLTAVLVLQEKINDGIIDLITTVILFAATFAGAIVAGKKSSGKYGTVCAAVMLSFLLLLIGTNIIFFEGKFYGFIKCVICLVVGSGLSCVLLINGKGKRRKKH